MVLLPPMIDPHASLNPQQKEAVACTDGPLLVVAGAGAGKTKVLTHRIMNLILKGVPPERILAITFTNKAAREMRERVHHLLHEQSISIQKTPFLSTFHALGVHIVRNHGEVLGLPRHFTILDRDDSVRRVRQALKDKNFDPKQYAPHKILGAISKAKGECLTQGEYAGSVQGYMQEIVAEVWERYEQILASEKSLDFDDLLLKPVEILKKNPNIQKAYQDTWHYIHIDEYQDTNGVQYELTRLLVGPHEHICVVGDGDQLIYSWRGATIKNILDFEKDFPSCTTVLLEQNYRSTQTILTAANDVIKLNKMRKEKNLFTLNNEGQKIKVSSSFDENGEAHILAEEITTLIREGIDPKEIAVLYRANFQSRAIEQAFLKLKIPYQLLGVRFFERKEVKDVLSYIRASLNPAGRADVERIINVPTRGVGDKTLEKVFSGQKESLSPAMRKKVDDFFTILTHIRKVVVEKKPSEVIKYVLKETGIQDKLLLGDEDDKERLENALELATLATKYDDLDAPLGIEKMLEEAALATDQDEMKETEDAVRLMTVHASKGLEFDYVCIAGLEEGLFPQIREEGGNDAEEERRLFYVALTRARKRVLLTYAQARTVFGSRNFRIPSSFIDDISPELVESDAIFDSFTNPYSSDGLKGGFLDLDEL